MFEFVLKHYQEKHLKVFAVDARNEVVPSVSKYLAEVIGVDNLSKLLM